MKNQHKLFWAALRGETIPPAAWPAIIERARREGVIAFLAARYRELPGREEIRRGAAAAHLARLRLTQRLQKILGPLEIPWVVLKGIDLAYRLYDDPLERPSGDCDILILPAHRDLVSRALQKEGYASTDHHIELHTGPDGQVDLHTAFINADRITARRHVFETPTGWEARIERLPSEEGDLPVLSRDDLANYLAAHAIHHHGAVGARWLLDLWKLLQTHPNANEIIGRNGRNGEMLIGIVKRLFETTEPRARARPLLDRVVHQAAFEGTEIPGLRFILSLREISGARDQVDFLRQTLFPSQEILLSSDLARPRESGRPVRSHLRRTLQTVIQLFRLLPAALSTR